LSFVAFVGLVVAIIFSTSTGATSKGSAAKDVSGSWRYKLTVTIETPEGPKVGSAVREVSVQIIHANWNPETPLIKRSFRGEAVVVDLDKRGVVFALLNGYAHGENHKYSVVDDAFPGPPPLTAAGIDYYSHLKNAKAVLAPSRFPVLVTFLDPKDPKTIKPVIEMERDKSKKRRPISLVVKNDHFEELFGSGVKIKDITIEITGEPPTKAVSKYLPSFGPETGFTEWAKNLSFYDLRRVDITNFK
jgi:hypothetical protein